MLVLLLLILSLVPLNGMDEFSCKKKKISNISAVQFVGNDRLIVKTSLNKNDTIKEHIFLYDCLTHKITPIDGGKKQYRLLSVDSQQAQCAFSYIHYSTQGVEEKILLYDCKTKEKKKLLLHGWISWNISYDNQDVIVYSTEWHKIAYRFNNKCFQLEKAFTDFLHNCGGTVYDYNPKNNTVLSYCDNKDSFYYGSIESYKTSESFTEMNTKMHSLVASMVKAPLLVFFCKNRPSNILHGGEKVHHCNQISVLNMIEKKCIDIDHPELIVSLDIHPNKQSIVTLSRDGKIRYMGINEKKCVYGPVSIDKNCKGLDQKNNSQVSFSDNGESLAIALKDKLIDSKVPFKILYGINYAQLMAIMFLLEKVDHIFIPKDLRMLIIFKMIQPYVCYKKG